MAVANNYTERLRSWFNGINIKIRNDWLEECVEYFMLQNKDMSFMDLKDQSFQQWLLNDIADTSLQSLPDINNTTKVLTGRYVLQIQTLIDISVPAFDQLDQICNLPVEKLDEEFEKEESSRVLKLKITDGYKTIDAMEYRAIKSLSLNLKPGCKLIIKGPINVSFNGILYLEDKNVTILGGEVDSLLESNSVINTLLKSLNISFENYLNRLPNNKVVNLKTIKLQLDNANNTDNQASSKNLHDQASNVISPEDDIGNAFPENIVLYNQSNNKNASEDDIDNAFLEDIDFETLSSKVDELIEKNSSTAAKPIPVDILDPCYPIKFNKNPVLYVKQVGEVQSNIIKSKNFALIIKIEEVIEKLRIQDGKWHCLVKISDFLMKANDVKQTLNVKLHSDLIAKHTGFDAQRIILLKNEISQKSELVGELIRALKTLKDNFMNKIYLAEIKVFPSIADEPSIIFNLEEFNSKYEELKNSKMNYD